MTHDPHLRMAEFKLPAPVPADVEAVAGIATPIVLEDIVKGRMRQLVLLTFKGTTMRLWQIVGPNAAQADDVMRAIAAREEAQAIAVIHPKPVPPEVDADRCYNIAVENDDGKFDSLIALKGGAGLGGDQFRIFNRRHDVDPKLQWFRVEPDGEVDIWFEGPVGMVIPGGEA